MSTNQRGAQRPRSASASSESTSSSGDESAGSKSRLPRTNSSVSKKSQTPLIRTSTAPTTAMEQQAQSQHYGRRRRRRGGQKRRQHASVVSNPHDIPIAQPSYHDRNGSGNMGGRRGSEFYRLRVPGLQNRSSESIDSSALLDHRDQPYMRPRRGSIIGSQGGPGAAVRQSQYLSSQRGSATQEYPMRHGSDVSPGDLGRSASKRKSHVYAKPHDSSGDEEAIDVKGADERTSLLGKATSFGPSTSQQISSFFSSMRPGNAGSPSGLHRVNSRPSSSSSSMRRSGFKESSHVNFPPSVPTSPRLEPTLGMEAISDVASRAGYFDENGGISPSPIVRRSTGFGRGDAVIRIDEEEAIISDDHSHENPNEARSSPPTPPRGRFASKAEEDVCFPVDHEESDVDHSHEEFEVPHPMQTSQREARDSHYYPADYGFGRRRRNRPWPDLAILEEWAQVEKESRAREGARAAQKFQEPIFLDGRLRPSIRARQQQHGKGWKGSPPDLDGARPPDDLRPYRFTYFSDELPATIHSQTLSELCQPGQGFKELFLPEYADHLESDEEYEAPVPAGPSILNLNENRSPTPAGQGSNKDSRAGSTAQTPPHPATVETSGITLQATPRLALRASATSAPIDRPCFWLDCLSPTDAEMKVLAKTFGIHPLTSEDILLQEAREKVELFRDYYLVSYRTFDQDPASEDYLEPVSMYFVVFRDGVISFHFSQTPHPANVRRRIRQLKDFITVTADWISYALIDDITDAFVPLIQDIEDEVDEIDDSILQLDSTAEPAPKNSLNSSVDAEKGSIKSHRSAYSNSPALEMAEGGLMLRRVGSTRKRVMSLYRLLQNKADVIKGFAKRCNEQWEVAPRSEIGLYLGDIQDHIVTMVSNLSHAQQVLSRSHTNYLAQINIEMARTQNNSADVLGRLNVLGTIVLPMNIVTGLFGMNCLVPGQDVPNLVWFWSITMGLLLFGVFMYFVAKRVYQLT